MASTFHAVEQRTDCDAPVLQRQAGDSSGFGSFGNAVLRFANDG
jgi:hypothetical protein